ncbi:hypothetical protein EMPG_16618, partial [Blastomyces silverae]
IDLLGSGYRIMTTEVTWFITIAPELGMVAETRLRREVFSDTVIAWRFEAAPDLYLAFTIIQDLECEADGDLKSFNLHSHNSS